MVKDILNNYYSRDENKDDEINRDIGIFSLPEIMSDKSLRLAYLYYSISGTEYSVFGAGSDLSCPYVIGVLLLIYRFITIEQFQSLLPQYSKFRLSNIRDWCNKKGNPLIAATDLDKNHVYYYLTSAGYNHFRSFFPKEFLLAARIPANSGKLPSRVMHDIPLRDVPYGCLSLNDFTEFDWFTSVKLIEGKTPAESIIAGINANIKCNTPASGQSRITADAIMPWRYENNIAVIIEQDNGTEGDHIIEGKLCAYGDYLNGLQNIESISIVFNVYLNRKNRCQNSKNSLKSTFDNISLLMAHDNITSLTTFYDKICSQDHSSGNKQNSFYFMRKLLDRFVEDGHNLTEDISSLKAYVKHKKDEQSYLSREASPQSKAHYTNLKNLATDIINQTDRVQKKNRKSSDSNDYSNLIDAINKGASILFTDNFLSYAYYLFPFDSGFLNRIVHNIEKSYGEHNICKVHRVTMAQEGIILKNCIEVRSRQESQVAYYLVHEISCDIASHYRLSNFLKSYSGSSTEFHCLILVSSRKDAIKFAAETSCIEKYCSKENPIYPNGKYNLTIRFIDYSPYNGPINSPEMFIPYNGSTIKTISM